jgi:uncharacterized damage-inducible protein DinB
MNPEAIRQLFEYHYWASQQVWDCIMALTDEQFTQPLDYSVGSIRNHIVHVMSATQRWIKRLQLVEVPAHLVYEEFSTRAEAKAMWEVLKAATLDYIYSLDQAQLDEIILWELPARGKSSHNHRWEILLHVANHGTDHRSQILAMLKQQFAVATVEQDMVFYLAQSE